MEARDTTTNQERTRARLEAAFTLMEIMIVLAILALIMGFLVGPRLLAQRDESRKQIAKMMAKDYVTAYALWSNDADTPCPQSLADLTKYRNKKDDKDPWKNDFEMKCGDNAPEDTEFGVVSAGPDRKAGTEDDVKSWEN